METEQPADTNEPSTRTLIRQLVEDAKAYAQAETRYVKAELGARSSHILPGLIFYALAAALGFALIVALLVTAIVWIGIMIGFGWAVLIVASIAALAIMVLARAGARHFSAATRPWQKP